MISYITEYITNGESVSLEAYLERGGYLGLKAGFKNGVDYILGQIDESGLKGRGGAYFPTGRKVRAFSEISAAEKFLICNADEGEPGTFKDRYMMERCMWLIVEGMTITALACGVKQGYIYLRNEYRWLELEKKLEALRKRNLLGENICGKGLSFDIIIHYGAGAYICGEETALLSSMEGKRGLIRNKPPLPLKAGLWGRPTLISNVETFACITQIIKYGSSRFRKYGTDDLPGTKLICLSGNFKNLGVYEVPFGIPVKDIIYTIGGGSADGHKLKFLQIGGMSGGCVFSDECLSLHYDSSGLGQYGLAPGTGAIYAASEDIDLLEYMICAFDFFCRESCGRCTPCREGCYQIRRELKLLQGDQSRQLCRIQRISSAMRHCSACGFGLGIPNFLNSMLALFETQEK